MQKLIFLVLLILPSWVFGQSLIEQKIINQNIGGKAVGRDYWLYTPQNLTENPALVVVMHGYSGDAQTIMSYSGMNELADTHGFIVAYPGHVRC